MGSDENAKVVSELMNEIRVTFIDYQVSGKAQTVSYIRVLMNTAFYTSIQPIW